MRQLFICLLLGLAASANAFGVIMEILGGLLDVALKAVGAVLVGADGRVLRDDHDDDTGEWLHALHQPLGCERG